MTTTTSTTTRRDVAVVPVPRTPVVVAPVGDIAGLVAGAVVVGYDGTTPAEAARRWAAEEAVRSGRDLVVLLSSDAEWAAPSTMLDAPHLHEEVAASLRRTAAEGAEAARAEHPGLVVRPLVAELPASAGLVEAARTAALVVLGSRCRGPLRSALLGSVSGAVSAHAACPVVVVHGDGAVRPGPGRRVVVGVDGSDGARPALDHAARLASGSGAELEVVCTWFRGLATEAPGWDDAAGRVARDLAEAAAARARATDRALAVTTTVVEGDPVPVLHDASATAGAVVVGSRGLGTLRGLLLGSVSRAVLAASACPVVVVRDATA